jgi:hypothetical protein
METAAQHLVLKVVPETGDKLEGHLLIKEKTTVTWKYSREFYVQFAEHNNPCKDSGHKYKFIYPSEKIDDRRYEVTCTIKANSDRSSFPYALHPGPPPDRVSGNGYCQGCCCETDSTM